MNESERGRSMRQKWERGERNGRSDERRRLANEIAGEQNGEMDCGNGDANGGEGEEMAEMWRC